MSRRLMRPDRKRPPVFLAIVGGGFLYGFLTASIPSPTSAETFWVANLFGPWLLLAMVAGYTQSTLARSVLAGIVMNAAMVFGFYAGFLDVDRRAAPMDFGLDSDTPMLWLLVVNLGRVLWFSRLWYAASLVFGGTFGAIGGRLQTLAPLYQGVIVAAPFFAEPAVRYLIYKPLNGPYWIWVTEVALGTMLGLIATRRGPRPYRSTSRPERVKL